MYIAKQSFKASNGKSYRMGDVISDLDYNQLSSTDRNKVKKKNDGGDKGSSGGVLIGDPFNIGENDLTTLW